MSLFRNLILPALPSTAPDEQGHGEPGQHSGVIALEPAGEAAQAGQVVGAHGGDPCAGTLPGPAGQHLRELSGVTAQGVQARAGSPHLRELELAAGVEVAGAAADPTGDVTNLGRSRDGGRRGLPPEGGQVGVDGGVAAAKAQRLDLPVQPADVGAPLVPALVQVRLVLSMLFLCTPSM
jgi:hypothetical protein